MLTSMQFSICVFMLFHERVPCLFSSLQKCVAHVSFLTRVVCMCVSCVVSYHSDTGQQNLRIFFTFLFVLQPIAATYSSTIIIVLAHENMGCVW